MADFTPTRTALDALEDAVVAEEAEVLAELDVAQDRVAELEAALANQPKPKVHLVQPGETLTYIAALYGKTIAELSDWNDLDDPNEIMANDVLYLVDGYDEPDPVPELPDGPVFGLNVTGPDTDGHRALLGGPSADLKGIRMFFQPGEAPHWNEVKSRGIRPSDEPWFSAKTLTEATLRAWVRALPADYSAWLAANDKKLRFTYWHECEADIRTDAQIAAYLATYELIQKVFASEPNGKFFEAWKILLRYSQDEDGSLKGSWPKYVGGQRIPVGLDAYWSGWILDYWEPAELLKTILAIHAQTGLRVCVPEVGGVTKFTKKDGSRGRWDADGSKRAVAIRKLVDFVRAHPEIESINWWCGTGAAGDHHLDPYPSNVAEWKRGVTNAP
jgi:hypothetical protein